MHTTSPATNWQPGAADDLVTCQTSPIANIDNPKLPTGDTATVSLLLSSDKCGHRRCPNRLMSLDPINLETCIDRHCLQLLTQTMVTITLERRRKWESSALCVRNGRLAPTRGFRELTRATGEKLTRDLQLSHLTSPASQHLSLRSSSSSCLALLLFLLLSL